MFYSDEEIAAGERLVREAADRDRRARSRASRRGVTITIESCTHGDVTSDRTMPLYPITWIGRGRSLIEAIGAIGRCAPYDALGPDALGGAY